MPGSKKTTSAIATLAEVLDILTVDELKKRVALLPTVERPTRKADLVALIAQHLDGERLRALWDRLDETQKQAVSEAIYAADGMFHAEKFQAQKACPDQSRTSGAQRSPSRDATAALAALADDQTAG